MATLVSQYRFENGYTDTQGNDDMAAGGSGNTFSTSTVKEGTYSLAVNGSGWATKTTNFATITTGNADRSMGGWWYRPNFAANDPFIAIGPATALNAYQFRQNNSTTFLIDLYTDQVSITVSAPSANTWFWCWCEYTASTKTSQFYINNVSQGSSAHASNSNLSAGKINVGYSFDNSTANDNGTFFDDVRIYNGVTTSGERSTIFNVGANSGFFNFM